MAIGKVFDASVGAEEWKPLRPRLLSRPRLSTTFSNALLYPSASSSFAFGNPLVVKNGAHLGGDIGEDVIEEVYYRNPL
jgi:hypothetical protein